MATTEPILVKVPEAAQMLGLSRTTVYELIHAGAIRAVHVGRAVRITTESLRQYALSLEDR